MDAKSATAFVVKAAIISRRERSLVSINSSFLVQIPNQVVWNLQLELINLSNCIADSSTDTDD